MKLFIYTLLLIFSLNFNVYGKLLSDSERKIIYHKLNELPKTRDYLWEILFPIGTNLKIDYKMQNLLHNILRVSLLQADTKVLNLNSQYKKIFQLNSGVAAFNKQGHLDFEIVRSETSDLKKLNDTVRNLNENPLFDRDHNIFLMDTPHSIESNSIVLLFHELSHAAFDQGLSFDRKAILKEIKKRYTHNKIENYFLFKNDKLHIEADLYDLISERYAFELEYYIDSQFKKNVPDWPGFFRFIGVEDSEAVEVIDGFTRRVYGIDLLVLEEQNLIPVLNFLDSYYGK